MASNWAIVIGINQYRFLQPLKYAKRDAEALQRFLEQEAGFDRIFLFTDDSPPINGKPTEPFRANLLRVLRQIFAAPFMKDGDNFWFFFSGHGIPHNGQDYLMPLDGDPEDIENTGISTNTITNYLRSCGADNAVMILDACRSGGKKSGEGIGRQTEADARQTGVISLFSCSPDQYSYELEAIGQGAFTYAKDAVFELMDAVLTSISTVSFVSLSQSPVFRRQWSSVYAALHDSRLPQAKLMQEIAWRIDPTGQPILAGDRTFWPRQDAATLKERMFDHSSRQKSAVGQSYSTLAWIPEDRGSWALPLRHERISSYETPSKRVAFQLQQVTRQLGNRPLAVYDRGYGNASFVKQTAQIEADLLLRLAANRSVFGAPSDYGGRGAPRKHGVKFKFKDPTTWPEATETIVVDDPHYGRVQLMRWSSFHFKQSPKRGMEIIRVEVLEPIGRKRKFQVLWLAWLGQVMPPLQGLWRIYLRRFALEHWYRFAKQRLHWTQPQLSSNQALERWSLLGVLMTWQLWLARNECMDAPLPWQSPQDKLAPDRIAQGFASILAVIGTPAKAPKPRGKSPGRATGDSPSPRPHYPTVKKRAHKRKQTEKVPKSTTTPAA